MELVELVENVTRRASRERQERLRENKYETKTQGNLLSVRRIFRRKNEKFHLFSLRRYLLVHISGEKNRVVFQVVSLE